MLSVCTIMKNEEKRLPAYLDNVRQYADEIILIDNGSTDSSKEIALTYGCRVIENDKNNFDLGRNLYIENAKEEWIFSLDLDEFMYLNDAISLKAFLKSKNNNKYKGYYLPSLQYYGKGKWATFYLCRLYKNEKYYSYSKNIHGSVGSSIIRHGGDIGFINVPIHHFDALLSCDRNFNKRKRNIHLLSKKKDVNSMNFLAIEYASLGDTNKAISLIKKALLKDEKSKTPAYLFYAQLDFLLGNYQHAIEMAKIQIEICRENMVNLKSKFYLYYNMIDSCYIVIENSFHAMNQDDNAEEIILEQIKSGYHLPHNYLNLYLLKQDKYQRYLDKAINLNPMLRNPQIYISASGPTIYEKQTSILTGFEFDYSNTK